jgi:hypothetical protein
MKRQVLLSLLLLTFVAFWPGSSVVQAGEVIDGYVNAGKYGEVINCAFLNTITLDGKLNDFAWQFAPWQIIGAKDATVPASNDKDASVKFATIADDKFIYVAAEITDEEIQKGGDTACNVWKDDSIEIYIDGENDKAQSYDQNDAQITVGADVIGVKPEVKVLKDLLGGCVGITQGPSTETIATGEVTKEGWNVEIAIPLNNSGWNIKPKDGLTIGFNVQYNDDDDGGDRDHKLIWCVRELQQGEGSWQNPSLFAELQFVEAVLAVNLIDCKAITWGKMKSDRDNNSR